MKYTLRELRARMNKTQEQVAKENGIAPATYNAWERDLSKTSLANATKIAQYFGVRLEDIEPTPRATK